MKKVFIVLALLILCLCSCQKKEYKLIELTGEELTGALLKENNSIVFAYLDDDDKDYESFKEDLEKVVNNANINIYYVDVNHLDAMSSLYLYEYFAIELDYSLYFVIENGQLTVSEKYTDYDKLFNDLKGRNYVSLIDFIDDKELDNNLDEAKKMYEDGNIGTSLDLIYKSWKSDKVKKFYNDSRLYYIINTWESYNVDAKGKNVDYESILMYSFANQLYYVKKKDKVDGFERPEVENYSIYNYKIDGDKILIADGDDSYKEFYEIVKFDKENLYLKNKNGEKHFVIIS